MFLQKPPVLGLQSRVLQMQRRLEKGEDKGRGVGWVGVCGRCG